MPSFDSFSALVHGILEHTCDGTRQFELADSPVDRSIGFRCFCQTEFTLPLTRLADVHNERSGILRFLTATPSGRRELASILSRYSGSISTPPQRALLGDRYANLQETLDAAREHACRTGHTILFASIPDDEMGFSCVGGCEVHWLAPLDPGFRCPDHTMMLVASQINQAATVYRDAMALMQVPAPEPADPEPADSEPPRQGRSRFDRNFFDE